MSCHAATSASVCHSGAVARRKAAQTLLQSGRWQTEHEKKMRTEEAAKAERKAGIQRCVAMLRLGVRKTIVSRIS